MKKWEYAILHFICLLIQKTTAFSNFIKALNYSQKTGSKIRFVAQGEGSLTISGKLENFKIHSTSHLKSNTYIECTGGVEIGKYFHCGRGLTILSSNHDYNSDEAIPYGATDVLSPVFVGDFVWAGVNVTILPGVTVGEGAVLAAGSVVTKDVPPLSVVAGCPARVIKTRDKGKFEQLKAEGRYY